MIFINGIVHPMDNPVIESGFVAVEGDKISAVGPMSALPKGDLGPVTDLAGAHILPGFVDAHCHLGMFGDALGFEADDGNESTDPCTPHLRAIDAVNPMDRCFAEARAAGVTTVLTGPGSANPIAGQFAALKTSGRWVEQMVLRAPVAMKFALGENPKSVYNERKETPITRMATAAIIRESLIKAKEYLYKVERAQNDEDEVPPDFDLRMESLIPVLKGELPVHCHAHRADDIATALRIARDFHLKLVVVHGTEGHLIPDLLAQEGVGVITGPFMGDRSKPELANLTMENSAILAKAGVSIAICTDHPVTPIHLLSLCAAMAARHGLDEDAALAAITLDAARLSGVEDRVGSITPGKDADLVITEGHPLDWKSRISAVYINGKQV